MGGLLFASAVTPHSFSLPADGYGSIALGGPGFERARVAIPPGGHDLHLEVRMSRPVFEAGIALVSIFGAASVVGAVMMGLNAEALRNENIKDDGFFAGLWTLVVASPFLIAGVLMAILDRHRRPTWRWLDQPAL
jgi:ABC-type sugar transport system permease subunit